MFPSAFAVPTGGILGALAGQAIRTALEPARRGTPLAFDVTAFVGTSLLGLVVALFTARKPDTYKVITVEDFVGGFVIGALTGLFSEAVLDRLRVLFAGRAG